MLETRFANLESLRDMDALAAELENSGSGSEEGATGSGKGSGGGGGGGSGGGPSKPSKLRAAKRREVARNAAEAEEKVRPVIAAIGFTAPAEGRCCPGVLHDQLYQQGPVSLLISQHPASAVCRESELLGVAQGAGYWTRQATEGPTS